MPECFALMTLEFCSREKKSFLPFTDNDFGKVVKEEIKSLEEKGKAKNEENIY